MTRSILLCLFLLSIHTARAEPLRILSYNVLYGFNHGKAPEIGAKWIAGQKPDIVALQELNGFNQTKLEKVAKKWNHHHASILKEKGFPVGLTANSEITVIEKGLNEMWHGYLHCKVKGMHLFVVHLSPSLHAFRMKEASLLCEKVKPLLDAGESVLKDKTWRIDFILADPTLAKRCTSARIPRDKEVDLISDHYPVEAVFDK